MFLTVPGTAILVLISNEQLTNNFVSKKIFCFIEKNVKILFLLVNFLWFLIELFSSTRIMINFKYVPHKSIHLLFQYANVFPAFSCDSLENLPWEKLFLLGIRNFRLYPAILHLILNTDIAYISQFSHI